jgi:hypothetical protein
LVALGKSDGYTRLGSHTAGKVSDVAERVEGGIISEGWNGVFHPTKMLTN